MIQSNTLATKSPRFLPLTSQSLVISSKSNRIEYDLFPLSSLGAQWKDVVTVSVAAMGWPAYSGGSFSGGSSAEKGFASIRRRIAARI